MSLSQHFLKSTLDDEIHTQGVSSGETRDYEVSFLIQRTCAAQIQGRLRCFSANRIVAAVSMDWCFPLLLLVKHIAGVQSEGFKT